MFTLNYLVHKNTAYKPDMSTCLAIGNIISDADIQFRNFDNTVNEFHYMMTRSSEFHHGFNASLTTSIDDVVLTDIIDTLVNIYLKAMKSKYVYKTDEIKDFLLKYKEDILSLEIYVNSNACVAHIRKCYFVVKFKEQDAYKQALVDSGKCKTTTSYYEYDKLISFYPDLVTPTV